MIEKLMLKFIMDNIAGMIFSAIVIAFFIRPVRHQYVMMRKRNVLIDARMNDYFCLVRLDDGLVFGCKIGGIHWDRFYTAGIGHAKSMQHTAPHEWMGILPDDTFFLDNVISIQPFKLVNR